MSGHLLGHVSFPDSARAEVALWYNSNTVIYIYIYIYRDREREVHLKKRIHIHIYIYICICILHVHGSGMLAGTWSEGSDGLSEVVPLSYYTVILCYVRLSHI